MPRTMPKFNVKELINKKVNPHITMETNEIIPPESAPVRDDYDPDDFLSDLNNDNFVSQSEIEKASKEQKKLQKEQEKEQQKINKERKQREKEMESLNKKKSISKKTEENELFSEKGSELYGKDKLQIIAKIQQYKLLFLEIKALQKLKIKKNPSLDELHIYLAECEALVETDSLETFLTDSILQTVKMVEYASVRTKYNISGLSNMLKANPQFNSLSKQLYLKYKVFSQVPPEYQMLMLVSTSTWICLQKNKKDTEPSKSKISMNKPLDNPNVFDSDAEN
jgi:hypothetical protein